MSELFEKVERWLIHHDMEFKQTNNSENIFHTLIKHAGPFGTPIEIFEPKKQPGILVVGAKVPMKNNQIARYLQMNDSERKQYEEKIARFCQMIKAVHKFHEEDGKRMVGIYVVMDQKDDINQQTLLEAIDRASEMYEKTSKFLLKTF
ncbi:MAG: DUF2299 domain-containing protein [Nitrosopumilaceae archaeon]|nr:DUF2299 domain-containing protein [Nitrosopumilaceae archaeon]NIU02516.1 DUF2299 domain-containing protein [Nitrosopumilaceae archaeon]NIU88977.1 DUF2299 domain-containing protein [Nitrosopumilaceae archaeon]NIV67088.1 DUF2299 domain-containing protein [Nitrosopumilaceae archaeon]NIX63117.1 DUF2299 domain-containing protein [Nitrosopumilaceae archaeon]